MKMPNAVWTGAVAILLAGAAAAQDADERALVTALFGLLQQRSFAENREFCGMIVRDASGALRATGPYRGEDDTCVVRWPRRGTPIASYHTHGAYTPEHWNEVPGLSDMESDNADGVNGWIATPGGRLWFVDGAAMVAHQVCGLGCLPSDPGFVPGSDGSIAQRYSFDDLLEKFGEE